MEKSKRVKRKEKRAEPTKARTCAISVFVSELTTLLMRTRGGGRRHGNKAVIVVMEAAESITLLRLTADGE